MSTNICSTKRAVWRPVKEFQEKYGLSKTLAYDLVAIDGFPMKRVSTKSIRVNMAEVEDFMNKRFNN